MLAKSHKLPNLLLKEGVTAVLCAEFENITFFA